MQKKTILFTFVALITAIQVIILPVVVLAEDVVSAEAPASAPVVESAPVAVETPVSASAVESAPAEAETPASAPATESVIAPVSEEAAVSEPSDTEVSDIQPVITEIPADIIVTPVDSIDTVEILPEPQATAAAPMPLVEAVAETPYKLPHNPLCPGITGDLNGDGLLNKYDKEVIVKIIKGLEKFDPCADLTGDGYIGPDDISLLIMTYKVDMPRHGIILIPKSLSIPSAGSSDSAVDCTLGDANGDNKIDYKDEGILLEMMKGEIPSAPAADLDGDGYISPGDLSILISAIKVTHKDSADVTAAEKGNCNVPTASIMYSLDGGETYVSTATVKNGDILTVKALFSTALNEYEYAFLDINNGMPTDIFMTKVDGLESVYNLTINRTDNLTATVSVRALNGVFTDNIVLTGGSTFIIRNSKPVVSGGSYGGGIPQVCTEVTYSDWSACVDGKQTRKMISKIPVACEWTEAQISAQEQTCSAEIDENLAAQIIIEETEEKTEEVLGVKVYPDGTLLRALNDVKIFIIENGFKRHVKTLQELAAKYRGQTIYNVAPEILAAYPTIE